jgi:hypothetical protein
VIIAESHQLLINALTGEVEIDFTDYATNQELDQPRVTMCRVSMCE